MDTEGTFAPESWADARNRYEALGPTAQTVVREVTKAMAFDREEYDDRVTGEVVETARQATFAETLAVTVGSSEEFETWRESHPDYAVELQGSDDVDRVAWHVAPAAELIVAATFQDERRAAVETLRRQAFGRCYRDLV